MKRLLFLVMMCFLFIGCGNSVQVDPGNSGLRWESGFLSGDGLMTDKVYSPGLHRLGYYHSLKQVVCLDSRIPETKMAVVTSGGSMVTVDSYVVFHAKCNDAESLKEIITSVPQITQYGDQKLISSDITEPEELYSRYLRDNVRVAVREAIVGIPLLEVNSKRAEINNTALKLLQTKIESGKFPVEIVAFNISSMDLPKEIDEKLRAIESIRLDKDKKQAETQAEEEDIERRKTIAVKKKEIVAIETETALMEAQKDTKIAEEKAKTRVAEQIAYTDEYFKKLKIEKDAEIEKAKWDALSKGGHVIYMGQGAPTNFAYPYPTIPSNK